MSDSCLRIIDANLNRLKEAVRVLEDICRFYYDFPSFSSSFKQIRHDARIDNLLEALSHRESAHDCGKQSSEQEKQREDINSILIANFKRSQESARVLEELLKLQSVHESDTFKQIRYRLYQLEKELFAQINSASN